MCEEQVLKYKTKKITLLYYICYNIKYTVMYSEHVVTLCTSYSHDSLKSYSSGEVVLKILFKLSLKRYITNMKVRIIADLTR